MPTQPARGVEVVLGMAAGEAAAAGWPHIGVAHMLMALCKLSEAIGPGEAGLGVPELRQEFEQMGIATTPFRRRLRGILGQRASRPDDGVLHRSPACRHACDTAIQNAARAGRDVKPTDLLHAALAGLGEAGSSGTPHGFVAADIPTEL